MRSQEAGICVYCQCRPPRTVDHVPPGAVFENLCPVDIAKVPCCEGCSQAFSCDDQILHNYLSSRYTGCGSLLSSKSTSGSRDRREMQGDKVKFLSNDVDRASLERTARRMIRGLLFYHTGQLLPVDCRFSVYYDSQLDNIELEKNAARVKYLLKSERMFSIPGVFDYRFGITEQANTTLWYMCFFGQVWFVVLSHS